MTEPDEALQWARERAARWAEGKRDFVELAPSIRLGKWDLTLKDDAHAYRAGQAASAERIKALERIAGAAQQRANDHGEQLLDAYARIKALEGLLREIQPVAHLFQWNDLGDQIDALLKEADR
jgi:hypothetical protein